jgi:hypothetical protein
MIGEAGWAQNWGGFNISDLLARNTHTNWGENEVKGVLQK